MIHIAKRIINRIRNRKQTPEDYWRSRGAKIASTAHLSGTVMDPSYPCLISVGEHSVLSACRVLTHDASTKGIIGYSRCGKVSVGNNCFIGADVILLPGTSIDDNTVIGAGAIVRGHLLSGVYVSSGGGLRKISSYEDFVVKYQGLLNSSKVFNVHWRSMDFEDQEMLFQSLEDGEIGFIL